MYFISKLYIQNNLPNTTKYENKCFFIFLYTTFFFWTENDRIPFFFETKQNLRCKLVK